MVRFAKAMGSYSGFERMLARVLERVPRFKRLLKRLYQIANYAVFRERGVWAEVHEQTSLEKVVPTGSVDGAPTFFGYYDKSPWKVEQEGFLCHQVVEDGTAKVLVADGNLAGEWGRTPAWSWQQGAMAQWVRHGGDTFIVYNGVADGKLVSHWRSVTNKDTVTVDWPVQAVAPAGDYFVSLNYRRLQAYRPDYGYAVPVSNFSADMDDERDGLWGVERESGAAELLVSLARLREMTPDAAAADAHKVNHVMFSPSGERFIFVYRWFGSEGKKSRLYLYERTSGALELLLDHGMVSHYCWRDESEIIAYARGPEGDGYYRVNVDTGDVARFADGKLDRYGDGHPSMSPCGNFLVTDTYPDRRRQQHLLIYSFREGRVLEVGRFLLPLSFDGVSRVDLHPRWSPDSYYLSIDSGHSGVRETYVIDVRELLSSLP